MKCFILMFPGDTFEKYTPISATRGLAMLMTLRNEAFQHTAFFRKFDSLFGLRGDTCFKQELYFHFKARNKTQAMNCMF